MTGGLEPIEGEWHVSPKLQTSWHIPGCSYNVGAALSRKVLGHNFYYNDIARNDHPVIVSDTWNNANAQFKYFSDVGNGYMNGEAIKIDKNTDMQKLLEYNIQTGDLLYWGNDDHKVHATIVSSVTTTYTWDSNILHAMGAGNNTSEPNQYQYLQYDLGSPIRVIGEE